MRDIDRLLRDSLKAEGDAYEPANVEAAETRFMQKRGRRRLVRTGGAGLLAAAAAVAVFALVQPGALNDEPGPMEPAALAILTRFQVGTEPLSIAAGGDERLWIASREGGSVSRIDLTTGRVEKIDLPGANEIVVDDESVWVSGMDGDYLRIDEDMPEDVFEGNYVERSGGGQLVDLAVGGARFSPVWGIDTTGCVWELTGPGMECDGSRRATDVATDQDEIWVLNSDEGYAWQHRGEPGARVDRPSDDHAGLPASEYGDMAMTEDTLWVSGGGRIVTVDLKTGERRELEIDGDYADLAVGPETVWALAGWADGDERGRVYELSHDLDVIGISDVLRGEPSDLVADANGVWITIRYRNEVMYLSRGETTPPVPPALEEELSQPLGPNDLVMVFSGLGDREGETYAMYGDGRAESITAPNDADLYPSFVQALYSEGPAVVVERRDPETLDSDLLYVDVPTGEATELVPGSLPAMSSGGQLAYWRMEKENPTLFITEIGTDFSRDMLLTHGGPMSVGWDAGGRFVYVAHHAIDQAGHRSGSVVSIDSIGELGTIELDPGEGGRFLAPSSREPDNVHLIRVETDADDSAGSVDSIELVEMRDIGLDTSSNYSEIVSLEGLGIDEDALLPENLRLQATGTLEASVAADGTITWGIGQERSWILGFRTDAWLVKESGEIVELGEMFSGGLAISPQWVQP